MLLFVQERGKNKINVCIYLFMHQHTHTQNKLDTNEIGYFQRGGRNGTLYVSDFNIHINLSYIQKN